MLSFETMQHHQQRAGRTGLRLCGQSRTTSAEDCCFFRPKLSFVRGFKIRRSAFGGRGGRGQAALRRLRLLFITANSVAHMRRLLTELNRGVQTVLPICVAQVLLFETCGSCSLFYDGAVPFQAYKVVVPGCFFDSQCAVVLRHRESDRNRGKRVHRVRRLVKMLAQVHACLANNCALRC